MPGFRFTIILISFFIFSLSQSSCISKKKFLAEVANRDSTAAILNTRIIALNREIAQKDLEIAEKNGENKALYIIHDKHEARIKSLEKEIENLINKSLSQQQMAEVMLQQKREEVSEKQEFILSLNRAIEKQERDLKILSDSIQAALRTIPPTELLMEVKDGSLRVILSDKLIFKPSTTEFSKDALIVIGKIAEVLNKNPQFNIGVEGHTDNVHIRGRDFRDNWEYSVLKANQVARALYNEFGVNPSQITPSGKGEFQPRASNESPEGRASNRRTVLIILPSRDEVVRMLREYSRD